MIATFAHRLGFIGARKGRGVLLLSGPCDDLDALSRAFRARFPRLNLYATTPHEHQLLLAALPRSRRAAQRLLARTRAHAVVVVGADVRGAAPLVAAARRAGVVTAIVAPDGGVDPGAYDYALLPRAQGAHVASRCVDATSTHAVERFLDLLEPSLRRVQRQGKQQRLLERMGRWITVDGPFSPYFRRRFRSLGALEHLRAALGAPQTLLCLGNGPSSEDVAVREVRFDALFRVNHSWLARGVLVTADCVFTGLRATVKAVPADTLLVFQTRADAEDMRYRCATLPGPIRYATGEDLGVYAPREASDGDVFRPTNGAIMVAVAAALQPARLVISGIDLFSHPAGIYPGDTSTPNAYTIAHDRNSELAYMLAALDRYRGELVILSKALREAWEAHRAAHPVLDAAANHMAEERT